MKTWNRNRNFRNLALESTGIGIEISIGIETKIWNRNQNFRKSWNQNRNRNFLTFGIGIETCMFMESESESKLPESFIPRYCYRNHTSLLRTAPKCIDRMLILRKTVVINEKVTDINFKDQWFTVDLERSG